MQVAIILRDILQDVFVAQIGEIGSVVFVLLFKSATFLRREEVGHVRVVLMGNSIQDFLSAQSSMGGYLMAEKLEHAGDADVGLPGGHVPERVHILVDFKQGQRVQLGSLPK